MVAVAVLDAVIVAIGANVGIGEGVIVGLNNGPEAQLDRTQHSKIKTMLVRFLVFIFSPLLSSLYAAS